MNKKEILIVIFFALIFTVPVLISTKSIFFRLDTDYDLVLPLYHFIANYIRAHHAIPSWNPYIGTGIPVIGDPISMVLNPFAVIPAVFFGEDIGMRIIIAMTVLMSGISMWIFLAILKVKGWVRVWGSILYEISGPLVAAFAAGHGGKILTYPFIPLFLALTMLPKVKKINIILSSVVLTLVFFSGDFYTLWFLFIFYFVIKGYFFLKDKNKRLILIEISSVFVLFFIFAAIKLIPFLKDVNPQMARFFPIDPHAGSIHVFLSPLAFIVPFGVEFYDRPFFQKIFGFYFNWYEYYAFISFLPFLFLYKIKKVLNNEKAIILIILICVGFLYVAMKYEYSPFYWIYKFVPIAQSFRVPQRIFTPLTPVLIALFTICAQKWLSASKVKKELFIIYTILILSIGWTFFVNQQTLAKAFDVPRKEEESIVKELKKKDNSSYYVATFVCCTQTFLVREKIPIINFYYGWRPKKAPNFINKKGDDYNFSVLKKDKPKYIISDNNKNFSEYSYYVFLKNSKISIWKTDKSNIFPKL